MLTLDEARGLAAKIWTGPNFRRTPLDPIMCDHVANLLVDEVTKATDLELDYAQVKVDLANAKTDFDKQLASLKDHYQSLNDQYERLKLEHADLKKAYDVVKTENESLKNDVAFWETACRKATSDLEQLKAAGKKDEAV